ncbi:MAG TPA: hypothetical protein PJ991_03675 [Kiritimatiellia bacterium]|nr:hypothetical protein [Kiritimatiellia bacterium]
MKNVYAKNLAVLMMSAALIFQNAAAADRTTAIKITHTPVTWAVQGQPLTLKARVAGGVGKINQVTLYYALFKDAAPFRVNMAPSGLDMYVGTIEAGLLTGLSSLSYYIEAQDREGTLEETPWYEVTFRSPVSPAPGRSAGAIAPTTGASGADPDEEGMSGKTMALIAGGVAAVAVGAYLIADSGGGSSGGSSLGDKPGNYSGGATLCTQVGEDPTSCSSYPIQILIDANGRVFSETLYAGQQLVGSLRGDDFTLTATINDPVTETSGSIVFSGTVLNENRIVGSLSGSGTQAGSPVSYTGTFTANKN